VYYQVRADTCPSSARAYHAFPPQAGVGTYNVGPRFISTIARWIAKEVDLGIGTSLDGHVKGGYRFLQKYYRDGDRICIFGFSRGAYTARALAGMLYSVGLLPPGMAEEVNFAFQIFKERTASESYKRQMSRPVKIEFIGVWDTVSAVGALIPRSLPFSSDNHITKTFRHAMSLDEHRAAFQCNPWQTIVEDTEQSSAPHVGLIWTALYMLFKGLAFWNWGKKKVVVKPPVHGEPTHVKEVWFCGDHGDVGGGNVTNETKIALSNVPLRWMIKEILEADTGIIFNNDPLLEELGIVLHPKAKAPATENGSSSDVSVPASSGIKTYTATQHTKPDTTLEYVLAHKKDLTATPDELPNDLSARLELDDLPSKHLPDEIGKEHALATAHDTLVTSPSWWLVEFLPFLRSKQNAEGKWVSYPRINFFRGRVVPTPPTEDQPNSSTEHGDVRGVNISPDVTLFHVSVAARMNAPECGVRTYKTLWLKKEPYIPKAKPSSQVKFVR